MKKLFICLFTCIALFLACTSQVDHNVPASSVVRAKLTADDWQSDLRFLQQKVHKDYSFLFKNITAKDFDAHVDKLYDAIPAMKEHEVLAGFARIVASFKYGHTDIGWRESPVKYHMVPVNFYWFSDGVYAEGADKKYEAVIGAKLIRIEGVPVEQALASIKPLVPSENDQYFKAYGMDHITIPEALHAQKISKELKQSITYTFEKNGKTFEQTIAAVDAFRFPRQYGFVKPGSEWMSVRNQETTPNYLKNLDKIYYYEYLPESKTLYVRHSQIQDDKNEAIPVFYKKVFDFIDKNDVEKLVLDVRLNGGGNNYKNKPIVTGIIESKKINKPGKFFVIIGRRTYSACQNLVNELSNYTNAVFVGEPTSENINFYGDNRRIELPKTKLPVFLSFAWWQDKPQWENAPWLAPQLAVEMSFNEYKTNKDPVHEACLNFSDKDLVLDPMGHLKELFMAGKLDQVEAEAKRMATDPKYQYVNFEQKFNQAGYDLINSKQMESALFVFQLNTKLYPKSANTWDSLAEGYWKSGKTDKAIEYYNKAIELDPHGVTGDNARNMLKQIKSQKAF
ncbi:MAG TPA: tetratricopeptide repeat protein [Chitinophagaceae bacterium]|nr:tetratricopeptide repeat protein [Chitinophagaceae bacterium]